jgi:CRP/FNR family cyclic AMP-dependent transcriptional regulator
VSEDQTLTVDEAERHDLHGIKLLADVPEEAISELQSKCRWLELGPDEAILERDDGSVDVYFIVAGTVRVMNYLGDEREVALADLGPGDQFGELSAVDSLARSARVVGNEHCVVAALAREDFIDVLHDFPKVALRLLDHFAAIIRAMNQRVSSLSTLTPHQRIYVELLRLADPNSTADCTWIISSVPQHNEIASWPGTEKQQVALAIGGLVRDGIMERKHRNFLIKDHAKLRVLASM